MVNISTLIGTGYYGEDVLHKLPWLNQLNNDHKIYIASRIKSDVHLTDIVKEMIGENLFLDTFESIQKLIKIANFEFIYDSNFLKMDYSISEKDELQNWIGLSFNYLSSLDRRFYNRSSGKDKRDKKRLNNYIAGLIKFFKEFFIRNNVDYFINTLEDDIFSLIAYFVAKRLNIKILGFLPSRFPRKGMMFCNDFQDICIWNVEDVDFNYSTLYADSTISGKHNLDRNLHYWSLNSIFRKIISFGGLTNYVRYKNYITDKYDYESFIFEPSTYRLCKYPKEFVRRFIIKKVISEPKYSDEKYLLFPLHYVDDAQLTFREPFIEQFDLIKIISRSLPSGYYLYVKPHPHYMGADVSFKKLFDISKRDNIKIINPLIPPIKLLKNSEGVITLNSTTGFEALMIGIPVISMGHDFYCKNGLCQMIRDLNDLPEVIANIIGRSMSLNTNGFVNTVYKNTIWIEGIFYESYPAFGLTKADGKNISIALNKIIINDFI